MHRVIIDNRDIYFDDNTVVLLNGHLIIVQAKIKPPDNIIPMDESNSTVMKLLNLPVNMVKQ